MHSTQAAGRAFSSNPLPPQTPTLGWLLSHVIKWQRSKANASFIALSFVLGCGCSKQGNQPWHHGSSGSGTMSWWCHWPNHGGRAMPLKGRGEGVSVGYCVIGIVGFFAVLQIATLFATLLVEQSNQIKHLDCTIDNFCIHNGKPITAPPTLFVMSIILRV
jgi:hypothetical protein